MRLKDLQAALQQVKPFASPIPELEQYPTSAHLAAHVAYMMQSTYSDIEDKRICDLGAGTGMLSIAVALMGAGHVTAFDIDSEALELGAENAERLEVDSIDFCQVDMMNGKFVAESGERVFDVVVMNPPFGTKRKGVDMAFLQGAVCMCREAVYSMHKRSTRDYIMKKAESWGAKGEVIAELKFDIGRLYKFHRSDSVDVEVDLWRLDVSSVGCDMVFEPIEVPESDVVCTRQMKRGGKKGSHGRGGGRGRGRGGGRGREGGRRGRR